MKFPGMQQKGGEEFVETAEGIKKVANDDAPHLDKRNMIRNIPVTIWISSGLVIMLLLFSTIMLMVTPTDSASEFRPLVRPRASASASEGEPTVDEEVEERIKEIYNRRGFINPDPDSDELADEPPPQIATRIDSSSRNRTRRPLQKVSKDFDTSQSYVKKHPNGTLEYVFPEKIMDAIAANSQDNIGPITEDSRPQPVIAATPVSTTAAYSPDVRNNSRPDISFRSRRCLLENCTTDAVVFPDEYPMDLVDDIMSHHAHRFSGAFGIDLVLGAGDNLVARFDVSDDDFLCRATERIRNPTEGYTVENKKVVIVNTRNYTQGVRVETCIGAGQPCEQIAHLLSIFKTECKQIYHYRTLVAIDLKTKEPFKASIRLPSCCKCAIKRLDRSILQAKEP